MGETPSDRISELGNELLSIAIRLRNWDPEDKILILIHSPSENSGAITGGGYENEHEMTHDLVVHTKNMVDEVGGRMVVMPWPEEMDEHDPTEN